MNSNSVAVLGGLPDSLLNFRGDLLGAFVENKLGVVAMSAPAPDSVINALAGIGVNYCSFDVERNGLNPIGDLKICGQLVKAFRTYQPSKALAYTIKPVVWGGIAARLTGTSFYALITGLGFAFQGDSLKRRILTKIVSGLYRLALGKAEAVIFQNRDNAEEFIRRGIVSRDNCHIVNGSGVNTEHFSEDDLPDLPGLTDELGVHFLCVARLLGEKGLREYGAAAEIVKAAYPQSTFTLVGPQDPSPDGIPLAEVASWNSVNYMGESNDTRLHYKECHVYVLPSYHEGLPRSTLEAMSTGRAVITTNAVGCRETVVEGVNGFQVDVGSAEQLAERMIWCIENKDKLSAMGMESRKMVEKKFDVHKVNAQILKIMGIE